MSSINKEISLPTAEQQLKGEDAVGPSGECLNASRPCEKQEKEVDLVGSSGEPVHDVSPIEHKQGVNLVEQSSVAVCDSNLEELQQSSVNEVEAITELLSQCNVEELEQTSVNEVGAITEHVSAEGSVDELEDNTTDNLAEEHDVDVVEPGKEVVRSFDEMLDYLYELNVKEEDAVQAAQAVKSCNDYLGEEKKGDAFGGMLSVLFERSLKQHEETSTEDDKVALRQRLKQMYDSFVADVLQKALRVNKHEDNDVIKSFLKPLDNAMQSGNEVGQNTESSPLDLQSQEEVMPGTSGESSLKPTIKEPMLVLTAAQVEYFQTQIAGLEACVKFAEHYPCDAFGAEIFHLEMQDVYKIFRERLHSLKAIHARSYILIHEQRKWSAQVKMELLLQLAKAESTRICIMDELRRYLE